MHDIEVDQSGRTDVLTDDTVLAFSNGIQAAIFIPANVKRKCYRRLKAAGMRKRLIGIRLFAAGLVLLLNVAVAHARGKLPRSVLFQHFSERSQPFGGLNNWRGTDERWRVGASHEYRSSGSWKA